jgi:hypothetical protein
MLVYVGPSHSQPTVTFETFAYPNELVFELDDHLRLFPEQGDRLERSVDGHTPWRIKLPKGCDEGYNLDLQTAPKGQKTHLEIRLRKQDGVGTWRVTVVYGVMFTSLLFLWHPTKEAPPPLRFEREGVL